MHRQDEPVVSVNSGELSCVLFDLDGLMVDSEPLQFRAYRAALKQFGFELGMDDWIEWHSAEASTRRWVESRGLDLDVQLLRDTKKGIYEEMIAMDLAPKPGVPELVTECAGQFRLAVVSASRRESIEACLDKFGLLAHFSILISGSEVARSKPYPDPYLAALQALDTAPVNAIALEDSLTGFRAASAADLPCIICPDHFIPKPDGAFAEAIHVTESLGDLSADRLREIHAGARRG